MPCDWKCNMCVIYGKVFLVDLKDFQWEKQSLCGKLLLNVIHFVKSFISVVITNSRLFLFKFIWNMALMCTPIHNLESYEYFRRVFVDVYVIVLWNLKRLYFSYYPYKILEEDLLTWKVYYRFFFLIYSHTCSVGRINSFLQKKNFYLF